MCFSLGCGDSTPRPEEGSDHCDNAALTDPAERRLSAAMVSVGFGRGAGGEHGRAEDEEVGVIVFV